MLLLLADDRIIARNKSDQVLRMGSIFPQSNQRSQRKRTETIKSQKVFRRWLCLLLGDHSYFDVGVDFYYLCFVGQQVDAFKSKPEILLFYFV